MKTKIRCSTSQMYKKTFKMTGAILKTFEPRLVNILRTSSLSQNYLVLLRSMQTTPALDWSCPITVVLAFS